MVPFGEAVLAWRLARGMTQATLARAASIPRPNLSAIERGDRDVTLRTLRALALALSVTPGTLADGVAPQGVSGELGRPSLERIAKAATTDGDRLAGREKRLAQHLRLTTASRREAARRGPGGERRRAGADRAYLLFRASESADAIASLTDRLTLELARHEPKKD